jgi:hypothetical protein
VLSVDPDTKRVTLTLKKTLLSSKLAPLSDLRQAAPGVKAHGTVTGARAAPGSCGSPFAGGRWRGARQRRPSLALLLKP